MLLAGNNNNNNNVIFISFARRINEGDLRHLNILQNAHSLHLLRLSANKAIINYVSQRFSSSAVISK